MDEDLRLRVVVEELAEISKLKGQLKTLESGFESFTGALVKYNRAGEKARVVIQGLTDAGNAVTATFNKQRELISIVERTTNVLDREQKKQERDTKRHNDAQKAEWERIVAEKNRLDNEETLAVQRITALREADATKRLRQANKDGQDVFNAMQRWSNAQERIRTRTENQANSVIGRQSLGTLGALGANATPRDDIRVNSAMAAAVAPLARGTVTLQEFNAMVAAVAAGTPQMFNVINAAQSQAMGGIQRYMYAVKNAGVLHQNVLAGMVLSWGNIFRILQIQVLHQAFSALINGMIEGVHNAEKFNLTIARIQTISQDAAMSTAHWSESLKKLAVDMNVPLLEVSAAAYDMVSNQVGKGEKSFKLLGEALQFSKVTGATAKESIDLISFAINAFRLKADDATHVAALMFKTIDLGNVTAKELATNYGPLAVLAHQASVSMKEVDAAISTMTIQGIEFDTAATYMRNVLKGLINPGKDMTTVLNKMGYSSGQAALQGEHLIGVLKAFEQISIGEGLEAFLKIFPDFREKMGALALDLEIYKKTLKGFEKADEDYANSKKMTPVAVGQPTRKGLNEIGTELTGAGSKFLEVTDFLFGVSEKRKEARYQEMRLRVRAGEKIQRDPNYSDLDDLEDSKVKRFFKEQAEERAAEELKAKGDPDKINEAQKQANLDFAKADASLKSRIGDQTPEEAKKSLEKIIEKTDLLAMRMAKHKDMKLFTLDMIDEHGLEKLDQYKDKIGELVEDYNKLFDRKKNELFDVNNIDEAKKSFETAKETLGEMLTITENMAKQIANNINKDVTRLEKSARRKDEDALKKDLLGKTPQQQAKILENHITDIWGRSQQAKTYEEQQRLEDEAIKMAEQRQGLDKKSLIKGQSRKGVVNDNLLESLQAQQDKNTQAHLDDQKQQAAEAKSIYNDLLDDQKTLMRSWSDAKREEIRLINLDVETRKNAATRQQQFGTTPNGSAVGGLLSFGGGYMGGGSQLGYDVGGLIGGPAPSYVGNNIDTLGDRDNRPIMARNGEFVVNENATRQFYSQLVGMNSGMGRAGSVSNHTVGDININYSGGGKSTEANTRDLVQRIRRDIKRGIVVLH